ncbi:glucose-methanol-choline oxidoreductase [Mycobacterium intermedium]|uniref:Glucose-methanol-choline oxidoreductase n=1 Tax=Mycobacterium intermedium TaxID=28445 RepID=A0A1E3SGU3_MYCIE|nr:GMC family oxidoreductase N-terminal domain-containing protein [Mycobacterium intermedium]MCV6964580.1 GMC family oxidoreductase N-terminal domain-containing protein [Mycobacterium intermedium]ODR01386.1 glucose-methanol-choline oxidoreductase [Mycobacterium intermedium]OPE52516.1 glucose-methanol-choline oxidoreductase [Mycobacterium intermedium]ORA94161.1 glucose-methanol-choline oxidoreductase [Mycobacterium intermedium]
MDSQHDYVVVGTGSAGAVVANRLSADPGTEVLALEAGPRNKNIFIGIPAGFSKLLRSEIDWDYLTEPQPALNGREIYWPRGKVLGGSSSINAMMWVRGFGADYDEWAKRAGPEWSYAEMLGYFRRIENVADAWHFVDGDASGVSGPMHISRQRSPSRYTAAWLAATRECGFPATQPNAAAPEGFCETVVTQRRGARFSTADAYLKPARRRKNLSVITEATATRVVIEGNQAVGVEYQHSGQTHVAYARREVVLCGGAVNTPQLLMLSGIGDRDHLAEHGIDIVHHSPEVGKNLIDHLVTPIGWTVERDTLAAAEKPRHLINYLTRRRGLLTSNVGEAYGFLRSRPELELPDIELIFAPAPFYDEGLLQEPPSHGVVFGPILVAPESTGQITLRSADPNEKPIIDPRYLSDPKGLDRAAMLAGLRICAQIAQAPAISGLLGPIARPRNCTELNEETLELALETSSHTLYHPMSTCRMGTDEASVVDPRLRVRGVDRLRIADASVFPSTIRGHTHAPSVLIGERAADLLRI